MRSLVWLFVCFFVLVFLWFVCIVVCLLVCVRACDCLFCVFDSLCVRVIAFVRD